MRRAVYATACEFVLTMRRQNTVSHKSTSSPGHNLTADCPAGPPIDPALLYSILSDYDLSVESNVRLAREILDQLKETAELEEQSAFDPAGTGAQDEGGNGARPESCPETSDALSRETDLTSLSNGISSLDLEEWSANNSTARELETLSEERTLEVLGEMFGDKFSQYKLQHTLRKCGGSFHRAMEELFNHVYFDEVSEGDSGAKLPAKGIEAFAEDQVVKRGRKGKGKKKNLKLLDERRSSSQPVSPVDITLPPSNAWQSSRQDIEFIAARTSIVSDAVAAVYHKSGASMSKTLGALLKSHLTKGAAAIEDDPVMAVNAHDLQAEFPTIASDYIAAIVSLAYPSTASAHELAKVLTTKPVSNGGIQIIPQYARPLDLFNDPTPTPQDTSSKASSSRVQGSSETGEPAERASAYAAARNAAFAQAYAAHRRARSDRLMGGAAAYYGQVGRELSALSQQASAAAADTLAAQQSTSTQLDLHGIDVLNGIRIAQEKVESWWGRTAESRANGRQSGFEIVVGRGTHSEGGRSKLGPAVSGMLKREGWKFEPAGAVIVVKGRVHR